MAAMVAAAFLWPKPSQGFLGESSRIVFFHVPCAWTASLAFLVAAGYSLAYLVRGNPWHDDVAAAAVRVGLLFAVLALVTGSLFAKIMWGSYWNWDPRESSFLLLLFLYGAYLFLRAAIDDPARRGRIAAAYALFAAVLMPFLVLRRAPRDAVAAPADGDQFAGEDPDGHADPDGLLRGAGLFHRPLRLDAFARRPGGPASAHRDLTHPGDTGAEISRSLTRLRP